MGAEAVILGDSAPVSVYHFFTCGFFADTVHPVVLVRKAAARPAKNGHLKSLKRIGHIVSYPPCVGYRRAFAHINALIDTSSQVLGKVAEDIFADVGQLCVGVDGNIFHF